MNAKEKLFKDRFIERLEKMASLTKQEMPNIILAHQFVLVFKSMIGVCGEDFFIKFNEFLLQDICRVMGFCQTCDKEIDPKLTHYPLCSACTFKKELETEEEEED